MQSPDSMAGNIEQCKCGHWSKVTAPNQEAPALAATAQVEPWLGPALKELGEGIYVIVMMAYYLTAGGCIFSGCGGIFHDRPYDPNLAQLIALGAEQSSSATYFVGGWLMIGIGVLIHAVRALKPK